MPVPSVVNVTQIATIDQADVRGRVGHLGRARLEDVWAGVRLVLSPDVD